MRHKNKVNVTTKWSKKKREKTPNEQSAKFIQDAGGRERVKKKDETGEKYKIEEESRVWRKTR